MAGIASIGWYLPEGRKSTAVIATEHGISEDALLAFGLEEKTVAGPEDHPSSLAAAAASRALRAAELAADDVDYLIFTGVTRDRPAPWVAAFAVAHQLGAARASAFDLSARCPGMTDALWIGTNLIRSGSARTVLVCSGDRYDHLFPPNRASRDVASSAFGAGGAAAILRPDTDNEIVGYARQLSDDLSLHDQHCPKAGGTRWPADQRALDERAHDWQSAMTMGQVRAVKEFFRRAERNNIDAVCRQAGFDDIDFLTGAVLEVPAHRAGLGELGLSENNVFYTTRLFGHLGPSAVLLSLGLALERERPIGPRLVVSTRTFTYANALAIRGSSPDLGIRIK